MWYMVKMLILSAWLIYIHVSQAETCCGRFFRDVLCSRQSACRWECTFKACSVCRWRVYSCSATMNLTDLDQGGVKSCGNGVSLMGQLLISISCTVPYPTEDCGGSDEKGPGLGLFFLFFIPEGLPVYFDLDCLFVLSLKLCWLFVGSPSSFPDLKLCYIRAETQEEGEIYCQKALAVVYLT